jgi:uncharacterized protein
VARAFSPWVVVPHDLPPTAEFDCSPAGVLDCDNQRCRITSLTCFDPSTLVSAAFKGELERIDELLRAGADIDAADGESWNPLHASIENWQPDAIKLLLERGADPNRIVQGLSPLAHALDLEWDVATNRSPFEPPEPELSAILIQHGANPNTSMPGDGTVLQWARSIRYPAAVELLIAAGAR